jgi:metal-responsive CopG/Arc/MetJ family transcriptional regulator
MATVNFSIPDEVKTIFNEAFEGKNRSAVIANLMRDAAEHELSLRRRRIAVAEVLQERSDLPPVAVDTVRDALRELRR